MVEIIVCPYFTSSLSTSLRREKGRSYPATTKHRGSTLKLKIKIKRKLPTDASAGYIGSLKLDLLSGSIEFTSLQ